MKTLILCVDRDDDLGQKGKVETPVLGRRANVAAAMALGLADPEDSDTNAVFAAVKLYDQMLADAKPDDQVEVATVTGQERMGPRGDRKLAEELQEVLDATHADEVIVVSDGAEDERIMPIIQSRVRVAHIHRSIVKQAPRLEGFYYVLTRLLDDRKQAMRFVLPIGLILLVWGISHLIGWTHYATGATLALAGFWLVAHAMRWERGFGRFFHDVGKGIRDGKVGGLTMVAMPIILVLGWYKAYLDVAAWADEDIVTYSMRFMRIFLPWLAIAVMVRLLGQLFDAWFSQQRAGLRVASALIVMVTIWLFAGVVLDVGLQYREHGTLSRLYNFDMVMRLLSGLMTALAGFVLTRYLRTVFQPPMARRV